MPCNTAHNASCSISRHPITTGNILCHHAILHSTYFILQHRQSSHCNRYQSLSSCQASLHSLHPTASVDTPAQLVTSFFIITYITADSTYCIIHHLQTSHCNRQHPWSSCNASLHILHPTASYSILRPPSASRNITAHIASADISLHLVTLVVIMKSITIILSNLQTLQNLGSHNTQ